MPNRGMPDLTPWVGGVVVEVVVPLPARLGRVAPTGSFTAVRGAGGVADADPVGSATDAAVTGNDGDTCCTDGECDAGTGDDSMTLEDTEPSLSAEAYDDAAPAERRFVSSRTRLPDDCVVSGRLVTCTHKTPPSDRACTRHNTSAHS